MTYDEVLPQVFPYKVEISWEGVNRELLDLFGPRDMFQHGTCFAITPRPLPGYVWLWMDESSYVTWREHQDTIERSRKEVAEARAKRQEKIEAEWGPMLP